jgi:hypothetical protein
MSGDRFLLDQVNSTAYFETKDDKLILKPEYSFHMYISQSPCKHF